MKKIFYCLMCAAALSMSMTTFTSCEKKPSTEQPGDNTGGDNGGNNGGNVGGQDENGGNENNKKDRTGIKVEEYTLTYITLDMFESDEWTTAARYYANEDEWNCYELYIGLNISNIEEGKTYTEKDAYAVYVINDRGTDRHDFQEFKLKFGANHSFELTGVAIDEEDDPETAVDYRITASYTGAK